MPSQGPSVQAAEVLGHQRAGAYHTLTLAAAEVARTARPGQFVGLLTGPERAYLLRRPFSIHRVDAAGAGAGLLEIVFDVVGAGTRALSWLRPHDAVDMIGPLGHPFTVPEQPAACLLVGGGYGTAPLFFLAERLLARGCRIDFIVGAATETRLFKAMEAKRLARTAVITTDDGSAGRRGLVTDPMPEVLRAARSERVYACGPMPMLAAVSQVAAGAGVPCEVAVEELMACGTGICYSCVIPMLAPEGGVRMARSCVEGPVLDGAQVAWAELGLSAGPGDPAALAEEVL
jgi:dihydroorotate dehydrogenase electron transfer subunit